MRSVSLFAVASLCCLMSCQKTKDKVNDVVEFDMSYSTNQTIPSTSATGSAAVEFVSPEVPTNSSSTFASKNTANNLISEIALTRFNITNQSGNLDFLKSISVYIRAAGLTDVLVAKKDAVPAGVSSLACDVTGSNIKEFIFKDKIQFRIVTTINNPPAQDQVLKLDETVHVQGKVL